MFKKFNKIEKSWILYDVANSAYTLAVMTVLFPIIYGLMTEEAGVNKETADIVFLYVTSGISLVVAFASPIIGSMSDFKGYKMKLFKLNLYLGVIFAALLCFPIIPWQIFLAIYSLATIFYTAANVVYDSFLTDVTEEEKYDTVSSAGFAWGYIGSVIPFILGIAVYALSIFEVVDTNPKILIAIAFGINTLWWYWFSRPMLKNVEQRFYIERPNDWLKQTFKRLGITVKKIANQPKLLFFLLAYFFYIDAVYTIIKSAVKIGESRDVADMDLLIVTLIVQIIAFPCAIAFGILSKKFGEMKMLSYGIFVYMFIAFLGYYLGNLTGNMGFDLYIFAALIGTAQGGLQAVSRSYYGKLIPKHESGEYYGFFNIFGRFASVMGPALMALTISFTNDVKFATLSLIPLLIIGFIFLMISSMFKLNKEDLVTTL